MRVCRVREFNTLYLVCALGYFRRLTLLKRRRKTWIIGQSLKQKLPCSEKIISILTKVLWKQETHL